MKPDADCPTCGWPTRRHGFPRRCECQWTQDPPEPLEIDDDLLDREWQRGMDEKERNRGATRP